MSLLRKSEGRRTEIRKKTKVRNPNLAKPAPKYTITAKYSENAKTENHGLSHILRISRFMKLKLFYARFKMDEANRGSRSLFFGLRGFGLRIWLGRPIQAVTLKGERSSQKARGNPPTGLSHDRLRG